MNIDHLKNSCFLKIHKTTLDDISKLTDSLDSISKDKISEILLNIVIEFNNYLDNININNHNIIIKNLYQLYIDNKDIKDIKDDLPDLIKKCIIINIRSLFSIETKCNDEIIESNSTIIYYLAYSIYKSIIILYSYEYYLKRITEFFTTDIKDFKDFDLFINFLTASDDEKSEEISQKELDKVLNEILLDNLDNDIIISDESCPIEDNISLEILTTIYDKIIKKFLTEVIISENKTLSINAINNIGAEFLRDNPNKENHKHALININRDKGIYHVLIIKTFLLLKKITVSNNFITIPQYIGICWYVSMLTGICYSDASRKLILSKIDVLKAKLDTSTIEASETNFINTVIYIIETITEPQLKYGDNIKENCKIFKYLKNELPKFIMLKRKEIFEKILSNPNNFLKIFEPSEGNDDYYFINNFKNTFNNKLYELYQQQQALSKKTLKKQDIKSYIESNSKYFTDESKILKTSVGINMYGFGILNLLYKILNINALYFVKTSDKILKKKDTITQPDVIIIQKFSDAAAEIYEEEFKKSDFFNIKNESSIFTNKTSETFTFSGNNYKLDYILYTNDSIDKTCNRITGCGHCISGINYNGKKYYYDSGQAEKYITCDSESIRIPCTLTRQDWNISETEVSYFTINKCFYRDVDIYRDDIKIEKDFIDESKRTFDNENIICVYVKISPTEPAELRGGNNTYKSTHKKVNIMNKNKTIIERIVYIDKNKNKFIKFNKKYESLSTFKYNRKNKYYFI
jgi:hypothetical protein